MPTINIYLVDSNTGKEVEAEVPDDATIRDLLPAVMIELSITQHRGGKLVNKTQNFEYHDEDTLRSRNTNLRDICLLKYIRENNGIEPERPHRLRTTRSSLIVCGIILLIGSFAIYNSFFMPPRINLDRPISFTIQPGTPAKEIASVLKKKNLIKLKIGFLIAVRIYRAWAILKAGNYCVINSETAFGMVKLLCKGSTILPPKQVKVFVPLSSDYFDVARQFKAAGFNFDVSEFTALAIDSSFLKHLSIQDFKPQSIEGFLYPETYFFSADQNNRQLCSTIVRQFKRVWETNACDSLYAELILKKEYRNISKYDVLKIASIVSLLVPEEDTLLMQTYARIYYNRLFRHIPFCLIEGNARTEVVDWFRKNHGLYPTPICNPQISAIIASLKPSNHSIVKLSK